MSNELINMLLKKYKLNNFNEFFIFGEDNNISLLKRFYRYVYDNKIIKTNEKTLYLNGFCKVQKIIKSLKKFVFIWRFKKANISNITSDLLLNPIHSFPESQIVEIYQLGCIYKFRISDIINLWKTALASSISMVPFPKIPKNPYINIEFDLGHIMSFYIAIRYKSNFMVPNIIQEFINCGLNLDTFKFKYFPQLMDFAIHNFIKDSDISILYFECVAMVSTFKRLLNGRSLSDDVSYNKKKEAVQILKPTLSKFLHATRSCNPNIRNLNKENILSDLNKIFNQYPFLGRRQVRVPRNRINHSNRIQSIRRDNGNSSESNNDDSDDTYGEIESDSDDETIFSTEMNIPTNIETFADYIVHYNTQ